MTNNDVYFTLSERQSFAPTAIDRVNDILVCKKYFLLHRGIIQPITIHNIYNRVYIDDNIINLIEYILLIPHIENKYRISRASKLGVASALSYTGVEIDWNASIMMFTSLEDAMTAGQHRMYPNKKHRDEMLTYVRDHAMLAGVETKKQRPLTLNRNQNIGI